MAKSFRVFKFGGSSVADAACMRRVADIIEAEPAGPLAVVLSASKGVTDDLLNLVSAAERQQPTAAALAAVRQRHIDIAGETCTPEDAAAFTAELFREHGRQVLEVPTAWRLDPGSGDAALVGSWLEGRAQAAVEHEPDLRPMADAWLTRRAPGGLGLPRVLVGHTDLLALP